MTDELSSMDRLRARLKALGASDVDGPPLRFEGGEPQSAPPPPHLTVNGSLLIAPNIGDTPAPDELIEHHAWVCAAVVPLFGEDIQVRQQFKRFTVSRPMRTLSFEQKAVVLWYYSGLKSGMLSPRNRLTEGQMEHVEKAIFSALTEGKADHIVHFDGYASAAHGDRRELAGHLALLSPTLLPVGTLYQEVLHYARKSAEFPEGWGDLSRLVCGRPTGAAWATDR